MEHQLAGRVALVTGGASGIGRATAATLAAHGASVVIADVSARSRDDDTDTAAAIAANGATAVHVTCDVTSESDRRTAVAAAEELGGLDVLVSCAGIFRAQEFLAVTEDEYDRMSDVNSKATFFMAQAAARVMVPRRTGVIVNLSSVAGIQGAAGFAPYCLTKFAVRGLTYALADELGPHGVRVNAIHPGFIDTSMTRTDVPVVDTPLADAYLESIPLRRAGTPQDVANTVLMLASDLGGYVNGASLTVDGGRMRS